LRYFATVPIATEPDLFASIFVADLETIMPVRARANEADHLKLVVHPLATRAMASSVHDSLLSEHALELLPVSDDWIEDEEGARVVRPDHKLGGRPHLVRERATLVATLNGLRETGYFVVAQFDFPTGEDSVVSGDWPFADGLAETVHWYTQHEDWWRAIETSQHPGAEGYFVHPVLDDGVMAGNGTIGLEILEDLPEVDAVVIPWGGGGLFCGIAAAVRTLRPSCRLFAAEVATAAPLSASLIAGRPEVVAYTPSFVDGIGSKTVFPQMLERVLGRIEGAIVASLPEVATAIRLLAERNRIIAEGAGACPVACALSGKAGAGKVVCVVSGGNIDLRRFSEVVGAIEA
jgi:hypothetical protein